MVSRYFLFFSLLVAVCVCQRPPYAGSRPIGFPALEDITEAPTSPDVDVKLGSVTTTTTERLPIEAMGDRSLVEALRKLPLDKQPFWLINWIILEENRTQPKTYPIKQNSYLHNIPTTSPTTRTTPRFTTRSTIRPQPVRFTRLPWPYNYFTKSFFFF